MGDNYIHSFLNLFVHIGNREWTADRLRIADRIYLSKVPRLPISALL